MRFLGLLLIVTPIVLGAMPFLFPGECALGGAGIVESYFPIALKNQWEYVMVGADDRLVNESVQVVGSDLVNGKEVYLTSNYGFGFVTEPIEFLTDDMGRTCEHREGKFAVWYPWMQRGAVFIPTFGIDDCMRGASGIMYRIAEIKVPAGTFQDAFRVTYQSVPCSDAGLVSETFVRGIGLVERQVMTFTGIQTWQLASANLQPDVLGSLDGALPVSASTWGGIKAAFSD
jgi:hypothetical protein